MLCCILFLSGFLLLAFAKRTLFHCFLPYRFRHLNSSYQKPTIMVTNDDGIDAPGLRSLVRVLVSTNLFHVLVCAPDSCVFFSFFMLINLYQRCVIFSLMLEILSWDYSSNYDFYCSIIFESGIALLFRIDWSLVCVTVEQCSEKNPPSVIALLGVILFQLSE